MRMLGDPGRARAIGEAARAKIEARFLTRSMVATLQDRIETAAATKRSVP